MSIELVLLRSVESLVQRRIARVERRLVQVNLSPALLRDIGLEGYQGQIALVSRAGVSNRLPPRESNNLIAKGRIRSPSLVKWQAACLPFFHLMVDSRFTCW